MDGLLDVVLAMGLILARGGVQYQRTEVMQAVDESGNLSHAVRQRGLVRVGRLQVRLEKRKNALHGLHSKQKMSSGTLIARTVRTTEHDTG